MPEASEILSNAKRAPDDYDVDLPTPVVEDPLPYDESEAHEQMMDEEARMFVENYEARARFRWEGFEKLRAAGVDCSIEPAMMKVWDIDHKTGIKIIKEKTRSNARFWLHDVAIRGRVGISAWVWQNGVRIAKVCTSLQYPYGPEWSVMRFDDFDVPTAEKYRGWRTALLQLIKQGVVTEAEVERAFGRATEDDVAELWWAQLEEIRKKVAETS